MDLNAKWEPAISFEEFAKRPDFDGDRIILPCLCGEETCQGWAAIRPNLFELMQHMGDFSDRASELMRNTSREDNG